MEDVIFYLIVAGAVIVNIVRNYQKVSKENKKRDISKPVSAPRKNATTTSSEKKSKTTLDIPGTARRQESGTTRETIVTKPEYQLSAPSFNYESLESLDSLEDIDYRDDTKSPDMKVYFEELNAENNDNIGEKSTIDLQLDTQEGLKKAFVHSLIFDRKY